MKRMNKINFDVKPDGIYLATDNAKIKLTQEQSNDLYQLILTVQQNKIELKTNGENEK